MGTGAYSWYPIRCTIQTGTIRYMQSRNPEHATLLLRLPVLLIIHRISYLPMFMTEVRAVVLGRGAGNVSFMIKWWLKNVKTFTQFTLTHYGRVASHRYSRQNRQIKRKSVKRWTDGFRTDVWNAMSPWCELETEYSASDLVEINILNIFESILRIRRFPIRLSRKSTIPRIISKTFCRQRLLRPSHWS